MGPNQALAKWVWGPIYAEREAGHAHPPSAEVKNVWSYTSTPLRLHGVTATTLPLPIPLRGLIRRFLLTVITDETHLCERVPSLSHQVRRTIWFHVILKNLPPKLEQTRIICFHCINRIIFPYEQYGHSLTHQGMHYVDHLHLTYKMVIVKYTRPGHGTNTVLSVLIPSFTPSTKKSHQPRRVQVQSGTTSNSTFRYKILLQIQEANTRKCRTFSKTQTSLFLRLSLSLILSLSLCLSHTHTHTHRQRTLIFRTN